MVLAEGGDLLRIEGVRGGHAGVHDVALVELELHVAGHCLLRLVDKGVERLHQRGVPLAVVDELAVLDAHLHLVVLGLLVEGDLLERLVGRIEDGAARGLVDAPALHADQPVFDHVDDADAVFAAQLIELIDDVDRLHLLAVDRDGHALFKAQRHIGGLVGGLLGRNAHLEDLIVVRLVRGVLEVETLVRQVPEVLVLGVVGLPVDLERDIVLLRVGDLLFPRVELPEPPRGDDRHVGGERLDRQLEPHLVVALAGAAVDDCVGALLLGDLNQPFRDDRPRKGGAQQVFALVDRARLDGRDDKIVDEFLGEVLDVAFGGARLDRLLLKPLELAHALPDVGRDRNHLTAVMLLEPGDDDRGVQTAGIRQNDFIEFLFHISFLRWLIIHSIPLLYIIFMQMQAFLRINIQHHKNLIG